MYLQALVAICLLGKLICKIFFGSLRDREFEVFILGILQPRHNLLISLIIFQRLVEKAWLAVTETCLAFTVFKDDLGPKFIALFTLLLFLKCFHWLAEDRVDYVGMFM